jgi:hypothetical protein
MGDDNRNTVPLLLAAMGVISVDELIEHKQNERKNLRNNKRYGKGYGYGKY